MWGEILRETAVLMSVFVLLDIGLALWERDLSLSQTETIFIIVGDVAGGILLAFLGMLLERWR